MRQHRVISRAEYNLRNYNKNKKQYSTAEYHHSEHRTNEEDYGICPESKYWEQPDYHRYMAKHGKHFSRSLAMWAVEHLKNNDGSTGAHWSCEEVKTAIKQYGCKVSEAHFYDFYFAVNHVWSDHFGTTMSLKTDKDVFMFVMEQINDVDGYDGMIFSMWLTKAMEKCWSIDWANVM